MMFCNSAIGTLIIDIFNYRCSEQPVIFLKFSLHLEVYDFGCKQSRVFPLIDTKSMFKIILEILIMCLSLKCFLKILYRFIHVGSL